MPQALRTRGDFLPHTSPRGWFRIRSTEPQTSLDAYFTEVEQNTPEFYASQQQAAAQQKETSLSNATRQKTDAPAAQGPTLADIKSKAEAGDAEAQLLLGKCFLFGNGMSATPAEAWKYFCLAAGQGLVKGKLYKGFCLLKGFGTPLNEDEGLDLIMDSALAGDTEAMQLIGGFYYRGEYFKQDEALARRWFQKAADLGDKEVESVLKNGMPQASNSSSASNSGQRAQEQTPRPEASSGSGEAAAMAIVRGYIASGCTGYSGRAEADFVHYPATLIGERWTSASALTNQNAKFRNRWPVRRYTCQSINAESFGNGDVRVTATVECDLTKNDGTHVIMIVNSEYHLREYPGEGFLIYFHDEKVVSRRTLSH